VDHWSVHPIGYGPLLTDWIKGIIHSRNNGLSQSEKRIASLRITMPKIISNRAEKPCFGGIALMIIGTFLGYGRMTVRGDAL
jgi:hypothetical protein